MNPHRLRAYTQLFIVAIIWGIAGPVIKVVLNTGLSPELFILYRFLFSSIIATGFFLVKGIRLPKDRTNRMELFIYSLLNSSVALGLLFWGTSKTSLLDMSLIQLFGPLLLMAAGYLFLKDHVTKREKIGTIIAFVGACVIGVSPVLKTAHGDGQIFGNLLIFLSLISAAVCGVLVKRLMRNDVAPSLLANLSFVVGFITILIFVLIKGGASYALSPIYSNSPAVWAGIVYMAVFSGNIAYILNNKGQKTIELSEAAPFAYLYPIFSAILAVFLLGDRITPAIAIGAAITFLGVIVAEVKKRVASGT